jgi:hypothetical protein
VGEIAPLVVFRALGLRQKTRTMNVMDYEVRNYIDVNMKKTAPHDHH